MPRRYFFTVSIFGWNEKRENCDFWFLSNKWKNAIKIPTEMNEYISLCVYLHLKFYACRRELVSFHSNWKEEKNGLFP